ncbi:MAG TPA: amino acid ABC transporter permease [Anaerolineales bacterium]
MSSTVAASMDRPPVATVGVLGWLRQNLFNSWPNGIITAILAMVLYALGGSIIPWAFGEANWRVVTANLELLAWGRYPQDQAWRLAAALGLLLLLSLLSWRSSKLPAGAGLRRLALLGWLSSPLIIGVLLRGLKLPTAATVVNNLGYYLYRPELLPLLDEAWRAPLALCLLGALVAFSWALTAGRLPRLLSGLAGAALFGLMLPLGLQPEPLIPGLILPRLFRLLLMTAAGWLAGRSLGNSLSGVGEIRKALLPAWLLAVPVLAVLLTGFDVGVEQVAPAEVLPLVEPAIWGGVLLTLVLAVVSILASFPIGVLLALGRRSELPVVKWTCVAFIEVVRGVPLITILFMAQVMLPFFLPQEITLDRVMRAMAGMTLFTAAYLAEIVRGGLQAIHKEQYDAARALGLSEVLVTGLIILPQALRAVIPPIMGQFVSIFKDTTLVTFAGLLDLLAVAQSVIKQREFLGLVREVYLVSAVFYFIISYTMSRASRRLEKRLGVEERAT